jgi:Bacterial archaeo-eukaryotic release factor family 7
MERMHHAAFKKLKNHTNIQYALYLPIDPGNSRTDQNVTKFNSTVATFKQVLESSDLRPKDKHRLLDGLRSKATAFSSSIAGKGVAIFISKDLAIAMYRLPFSPKAAIYYDLPHLQYEPLEDYFEHPVSYWVLLLSANGCRLLKSNGRTLSPVRDDALQADLATALRFDELSHAGTQAHSVHESGHKGDGGFHGHGGFKDMRKKYLSDYFRTVDGRVREFAAHRPGPILLVGVEHIQTLYKTATHNKHARLTKISLDPHSFSLPALQQQLNALAT